MGNPPTFLGDGRTFLMKVTNKPQDDVPAVELGNGTTLTLTSISCGSNNSLEISVNKLDWFKVNNNANNVVLTGTVHFGCSGTKEDDFVDVVGHFTDDYFPLEYEFNKTSKTSKTSSASTKKKATKKDSNKDTKKEKPEAADPIVPPPPVANDEAAALQQAQKSKKAAAKALAKRKRSEEASSLEKTRSSVASSTPSVKKPRPPSVMKQRTLKGKVKVLDTIIGSGGEPKPGQQVSLTYTGSLLDGTVFDKNKSKKNPLKFRLGLNEVVKGLEVGVMGMRVGGEREIVIPPEMGYGKKKQGDIPKESTLVFLVQLVGV
ncbi:hypothetical protein TrVE_jg8266 [Triparma verrucosa]|uniref:peptidylprolyl isomerase n=1 Tax=Triparma verrucosa TaxID=1606542 RepID=A0A9W6ZCE5_9STRA|nr:hypothetical protein TrVE_jg8266 [Triparma verrucosa]